MNLTEELLSHLADEERATALETRAAEAEAQRQATERRAALEADYRALVRRLLAGAEGDAAAVQELLTAVGRTAEDLRRDVARLEKLAALASGVGPTLAAAVEGEACARASQLGYTDAVAVAAQRGETAIHRQVARQALSRARHQAAQVAAALPGPRRDAGVTDDPASPVLQAPTIGPEAALEQAVTRLAEAAWARWLELPTRLGAHPPAETLHLLLAVLEPVLTEKERTELAGLRATVEQARTALENTWRDAPARVGEGERWLKADLL